MDSGKPEATQPDDQIYVKSTSPLVVARRALRLNPDTSSEQGYLLAYPSQHAIQFQLGTPSLLGQPHAVAPLLLDRCVSHVGTRIPLIGRLRVCCLNCGGWVRLGEMGVSGLCLGCRPCARVSCTSCGCSARSDQIINGECLLCLSLSRIFLLVENLAKLPATQPDDEVSRRGDDVAPVFR